MNHREVIALLNSGFCIIIIIVVGLLINGIQKILMLILSTVFTIDFTNIFINKITFIGVIHHELAHTIFALLTGADVTSIHLFKPNSDDSSLGNIEYSTRGPLLIRGIQLCLTSIAPIICGITSCVLIYKYLISTNIFLNIILGFILLCIILHMDLSWADIKSFILGLPAFIIISFTILYITQFNFLDYVCK